MATLQVFGPRMLVEVSIPDALAQALSAQQQTIPTPNVGHGLIDTGASNTCIDEAVAQALGLQVINKIQVNTPAGQVSKDVYGVKLSFPGTALPPIPFFAAGGAELANQGLVALIGRDFLMNKVLHYDGTLSTVSLSW